MLQVIQLRLVCYKVNYNILCIQRNHEQAEFIEIQPKHAYKHVHSYFWTSL